MVWSASVASTSSSSSSTESGYCESDATVSECDSRSDVTDGLDTGAATTVTDPYGFSLA